jgi:hypothetical protein
MAQSKATAPPEKSETALYGAAKLPKRELHETKTVSEHQTLDIDGLRACRTIIFTSATTGAEGDLYARHFMTVFLDQGDGVFRATTSTQSTLNVVGLCDAMATVEVRPPHFVLALLGDGQGTNGICGTKGTTEVTIRTTPTTLVANSRKHQTLYAILSQCRLQDVLRTAGDTQLTSGTALLKAFA